MPTNNPLGLDLELANIDVDPTDMDDQDEWATPKPHTCELWIKSSAVPFWSQQMVPELLTVLMEKHFDQPPQVYPIQRPWGTFIVYIWDDSDMAIRLADTGYFEKVFDYNDLKQYDELKNVIGGGYQVKLKFRLADRHLDSIIENLNPPKKTLRPKEVTWAKRALKKARELKKEIEGGGLEITLGDGSIREVTEQIAEQVNKEIEWLEEALKETAKANGEVWVDDIDDLEEEDTDTEVEPDEDERVTKVTKNWSEIKNDKSYTPPDDILAQAWEEVREGWGPEHTKDWKMDHVGWGYGYFYFEDNEFNFWCGPAYEDTLDDSVGIYDELNKLFADVGTGIFNRIEIGASTNHHQFNLDKFQSISGFPTDKESVKKEVTEFLKIRMDLLGAKHHASWDDLDED